MHAGPNRMLRLAVVGAVVLAGCATPPPPPPPAPAPKVEAPRPVKSYVVLLESPDGTTGQVVVRGTRGEQVIDRARTGVPLDGSRAAAPVAEEKIRADFATAMSARPLLPEQFLLYFELAGTNLTPASQALLPRILESIAKRPGVEVSIIGHTDTMGRPDINETLGLRRAELIAKIIREQGLRADIALAIESHGERNQLVQTPDETAEPRNRRVEISIR